MALGEILRKARIEKGLTISEVAENTHLLSQVVEGLENEDFRRIAAPIYGRGFVKLYAQLLDLDPAPLVEDFNRLYLGERNESPRHRPILAENMPEAKPERVAHPQKQPQAVAPEPTETVLPPPRITIPGLEPAAKNEPLPTETPSPAPVAEVTPEVPAAPVEIPLEKEENPPEIPAAPESHVAHETPQPAVMTEMPATSEAPESEAAMPTQEKPDLPAVSPEVSDATGETPAQDAQEEEFAPIVPGEPDLFHPYVPPKVEDLPPIPEEEPEERPRRSVFGPLADCTKGLGRGFGEAWQDFVVPHSRELLLGLGVAVVAVMLGIGIKTLFAITEKMSRESAAKMIEKCDPPPAMYAD